ncbi:sigma-70 family RNA polymerase sigma factor [Marinitenerispora sediminis]|uniref:Transcriptional regulator n=1 Tax=Marinitenerispora sediminis TaxID=1931232 RepID=A0A368T448_9ACTN|nr:sigma-70 family RNA polymerase sigma factor [Marinitenerispora sediminis]RCV49748.1 transcriptional regulator [Marinitenerispora sediminis]RCV53562.1 transcriptional regulator [Marinitenerispora sediminis]RCV57660.1 transcriptional regulator [Marinitenerispora sediminis]
MREVTQRFSDLATEIAEISDPLERTKRAHEAVTDLQEVTTELLRIRRESVEELIAQGMKQTEIGRQLDISRQMVGKLIKASPPPERAFLGSGRLTIAVGEKREAAKDHGPAGPAVATEDLAAFDMLSGLARELRLEASYETVAPPGMIDLNRDNLVVICGPRLSPMIGQILASDPHIAFDRDESGWYLQDQVTGIVYRSPMDAGERADYAYLGRLPRPDARGTFVYLAGIHAVGATGVTHWLTHHLAEVYREVGRRRFSTLIRCTYTTDPLQITGSERVTPLYRRGAAA